MSATATLMGEETGAVLAPAGDGACAVPDGYTLLRAGVTRRVRANRDWLHELPGEKPWTVADGAGEPVRYGDVKVLGGVRFVTGVETRTNCGRPVDSPSSWVETDAAILVK